MDFFTFKFIIFLLISFLETYWKLKLLETMFGKDSVIFLYLYNMLNIYLYLYVKFWGYLINININIRDESLYGFNFTFLVIFIKESFMVFAIFLSFVSVEPFSNKVIRLEFDPISLKYGFMVSIKFGCPLHSWRLNFYNIVFSISLKGLHSSTSKA